jgi:hypothetical protein
MILAFAFCGIDFAGIARIFTPETGRDEPAEVWYLLGAWFLAAAFNASLTWWGVAVAILQHNGMGGVLVGQAAMTKIVPIFVAAMVLLIRVLLINTFSIAGERLFSQADERPSVSSQQPQVQRPIKTSVNYRPVSTNVPKARPYPYTSTPSDVTYQDQQRGLDL